MSTANTMLSEDVNIVEFMEILKNAKMQAPLNELSALITYIDTMEKQFDKVVGELQDIKQKLSTIEEKQNPLKSTYVNMVTTLETKVTGAREHLNGVKEKLVENVKKAVSDFKQNGLSALNGVMSFLGVKSGLMGMKESLQHSIGSTEKSINRIDAISSELHGVGGHVRNIGRVISGKEQQPDDIKPNGTLNKIVQMPFHAIKDVLSGIVKQADKAIGSLERLEQTTEAKREGEGKSSVRKNLKEIRESKQDAPASDKGAKQPEISI